MGVRDDAAGRSVDPAGTVYVPPGAPVTLPGRGTTFVRHTEGPQGAPTVVLLHGYLATGALNWYRCFEPLREHFNVLAIDHRGHGRGIRSGRRFRLSDCADDAAAVAEQYGSDRVIPVGYSMGGPVAQLLWRRHRHLVSGMVLIATGSEFVAGNRHRYAASTLLVAAAPLRLARSVAAPTPREWQAGGAAEDWGGHEVARHSGRVMLEAAHACANYSAKRWIGKVDVPTTVVVTERDNTVSPAAQLRLAEAIPESRLMRLAGGHMACLEPGFGRIVTDACREVSARAGR